MAAVKPAPLTSAATRGGTETSPELSALKAAPSASSKGSSSSSRSTSAQSTTRTSNSGSRVEGHALDRDLRLATVDQVGNDAARTASHREAHVPVTAVEVQVAVAGGPENRWPIRCHRPVAGPELAFV